MVFNEANSALPPPPPITWAQRTGTIFLTFCLEDCRDPEIKIEPDKIYFRGVGGTDQKLHELTINLYKEIEPEKCVKWVRERNIEMVLKKKEVGGDYWPQLTKEKVKYHWLKVDFNRWQDEESSDEDGGGGGDLEEIMKSIGGLGGGGAGGDTKPTMEDVYDGDLDSDDENLPDLE